MDIEVDIFFFTKSLSLWFKDFGLAGRHDCMRHEAEAMCFSGPSFGGCGALLPQSESLHMVGMQSPKDKKVSINLRVPINCCELFCSNLLVFSSSLGVLLVQCL